jgi:transcriptional regulator with XRE-family HTH domain
MGNRTPDPTDIYVGKRIKLARVMGNMSQTELGEHLGVTFQQVQKYESGKNRVGAGRLAKIAKVFKQPIPWFYGDDEHARPATNQADVLQEMLTATGGIALARAFIAVPQQDMRDAVVMIARKLAAFTGEAAKPARRKAA